MRHLRTGPSDISQVPLGSIASFFSEQRFSLWKEEFYKSLISRRILAEELRSLGWKHGELEKQLKADPDKVRIARRLRGEMTVTLKWIAGELKMGNWTYLSNNLSRYTKRSSS